jgi:hypothetical protein
LPCLTASPSFVASKIRRELHPRDGAAPVPLEVEEFAGRDPADEEDGPPPGNRYRRSPNGRPHLGRAAVGECEAPVRANARGGRRACASSASRAVKRPFANSPPGRGAGEQQTESMEILVLEGPLAARGPDWPAGRSLA